MAGVSDHRDTLVGRAALTDICHSAKERTARQEALLVELLVDPRLKALEDKFVNGD